MFRAEEEHLSSSSGLVKNLNRQLEKKRRLEEEALQKVIIFFVICYYWVSNNLLTLQFSNFNLHQDHLEGLSKQTAGPCPQSFWLVGLELAPDDVDLKQVPRTAAAVAAQDPRSENHCAKRFLLIFWILGFICEGTILGQSFNIFCLIVQEVHHLGNLVFMCTYSSTC